MREVYIIPSISCEICILPCIMWEIYTVCSLPCCTKSIYSLNPNRRGMPADSNRGACWSCWSFKSNAPMPRLWYCSLLYRNCTKGGALVFKDQLCLNIVDISSSEPLSSLMMLRKDETVGTHATGGIASLRSKWTGPGLCILVGISLWQKKLLSKWLSFHPSPSVGTYESAALWVGGENCWPSLTGNYQTYCHMCRILTEWYKENNDDI